MKVSNSIEVLGFNLMYLFDDIRIDGVEAERVVGFDTKRGVAWVCSVDPDRTPPFVYHEIHGVIEYEFKSLRKMRRMLSDEYRFKFSLLKSDFGHWAVGVFAAMIRRLGVHDFKFHLSTKLFED